VGLLASLSLIAITLLLSYLERAALEWDIAVGTVRAFVQLTLVGYVIKLIFGLDRWYYVLLMVFVMMGVASVEGRYRSKVKLPGQVGIIFVAMAVGVLITMVLTALFVVKVRPWYSPRYFIPIAGMILGNSMKGAALVMNRLKGEIGLRRGEIEAALALGATARKASEIATREAMRAAMIPAIAGMVTAGIIHFPGMMTGQIIAGGDPLSAVQYQIVIYYMIAACVGLTCFVAIRLAARRFFTRRHQLVKELL
jgi:putative ABC transport system permease protein